MCIRDRHFTAADKGTIYALWFAFQSILPTFTGGFADRYGYKRSLFFAITLNVLGYCLMATQTSFLGFTFGIVVLATGTAFFKPSLQGSLAQNLDRTNSSLGWGIFYWVVNVGAAIGPMLANFIRHDYSWQALFFTAAAVILATAPLEIDRLLGRRPLPWRRLSPGPRGPLWRRPSDWLRRPAVRDASGVFNASTGGRGGDEPWAQLLGGALAAYAVHEVLTGEDIRPTNKARRRTPRIVQSSEAEAKETQSKEDGP